MPNLSGKKRIEILKIYRSFSRPEIYVLNIVVMQCIFLNHHSFDTQWNSLIKVIIGDSSAIKTYSYKMVSLQILLKSIFVFLVNKTNP